MSYNEFKERISLSMIAVSDAGVEE